MPFSAAAKMLGGGGSSKKRLAAQRNRLCNATMLISLMMILFTGSLLMRSTHRSPAVATANVLQEETQPPSASKKLGDTYSLYTKEFIKDIQSMDKKGVFLWSRDDDSLIEYATYRPSRQPPLRILVVAQLHAREMFSADVARLFMAAIMAQSPELIASYVAKNATLSEWTIVPVANPCGRDAVVAAYQGAKDSKPWDLCLRGNCAGVDLNRNWITYGSSLYKQTSSLRVKRGRFWGGVPETNPGPEAFSEPESKFLRLLIHDRRPDLVLSLHTGGVGFLHPPEDGDLEADLHDKFSFERIAQLKRLVGWARVKSGIRPREQRHLEDKMVKVAGGSMLDYCLRHDVPLAATLELYVTNDTRAERDYGPSPPAYRGTEHWGSDPWDCHRFYNPPQTLLLDSANRWLRLWKALFYLKASDRALLFVDASQR